MWIYNLYHIVVIIISIFPITRSLRNIPLCSASSSDVWIPLRQVGGSRGAAQSDISQHTTHFCITHATSYSGSFSWAKAAEQCNVYKGFLLYSFNLTHLLTIAGSYSSEYPDIASAPIENRTLFMSLHDQDTEGEYKFDMLWAHGKPHRFTTPVNQTSPDSPVQKIITRGRFHSGITMWNPNDDGVLSPQLINSGNENTRDLDCMAVVVGTDSSLKPTWINCNAKANQAICVREGTQSNRGSCLLHYNYLELVTNTEVLSAAIIRGGLHQLPNQFFYAENVADAKRLWLKTDDDARSFILPNYATQDASMRFLILCKPGWFPTSKLDYPIANVRCTDIAQRSGSNRNPHLCRYYDGCQFPDGERSLFKGTHIQICNSQGYCKPNRIDDTHGTTECTCQLGFQGESCEDVSYNPCSDVSNPHPCGEDQECVAQQHDYYCNCKGKLSYNKYSCPIDVDECASNPCRNNATCVDQLAMFYCDCKLLVDPKTSKQIKYPNGTQAHWKGAFCDLDPINSCLPKDPCVGNPNTDYQSLYGQSPAGTCRDLVDGFYCACDYPWSGLVCERYDANDIVQAIKGPKRALVYIYLVIFIIFNFSCMLLTMLRRREITQGRYKTDEMIISAYESQRKVERDKLIKFVEEAAYSSDEEDLDEKRTHSSTVVKRPSTVVPPSRIPSTTSRGYRRSVEDVKTPSGILKNNTGGGGGIFSQTDPNTSVGFQDTVSTRSGNKKAKRNNKRRKPKADARRGGKLGTRL